MSIVVPAFNRERFIAKAIDSVLTQTYQDWELMIADDGSTDRTCEIVESYGDTRIRLLRSEINTGAGGARNRALAAAKGEYVAFLDSDDYWFETKLEQQVRLLDERPSIGMIYGDEIYESEEGEATRYGFGGIRPFEGRAFHRLANRFIIRTSTVMVRRSVLDTIEWFDETILSGQDYDLFVRIAHETEVYPMEQPLGGHALHRTSLRQDLSKAGPHQIRAAYKVKRLFNVPWWRMPRTLARCHQEYAFYLVREGLFHQARAHFLRSFCFRPQSVRAGFLGLLCSFNGTPYRWYQSFRRREAMPSQTYTKSP